MAQWNFDLFSVLMFLSAGFAVLIASLAWMRRTIPESRTMAIAMAAIAFWSATTALEAAATQLSTKVFWAKIAYLGTYSTPPLYLTLALQYNKRGKWLNPRRLALLWVIPILTMVFALTNNWHHLIWSHFGWAENAANTLIYYYGPAFWVGTSYAYLLVLVATGHLIFAALHLSVPYKRQATAIIAAAILPLLGSLIYVTKINPFLSQDISPIYFLLTGTILTWSIFRYRFLDLSPIARSKLVDTISAIVIVVNRQLRVSDINRSAIACLEKRSSEIIGQPVQQALTHWPILIEILSNIDNTPTIQKVIPDRDENWYELKISPLKGKRDQLWGWLLLLHDITEQRELENALRTSEALYRSVIENSNDGIAIAQNNLVKYCNPQLADMLGYSVEDIKGQPFKKFIAPSEAEIVQERHEKRMQGFDTPSHYETMLVHASGEIIPVEFNISSMELNHETAVLAMIHDIRDRIRAREQINRLAAVVQQAQETIIITDLDGQIEYTNPQFEKMTGYTAEEVAGKNPRILKSGQQDQAFYEDLWDTITAGYSWTGEFVNQRKDGSLYHEKATIFPIKNQNGQITHYAAVKRDITTQIKTERELIKYARQQELLNLITRATVKATDLDEALQTLAKQLNHFKDLVRADGCFVRAYDANESSGPIPEEALMKAALRQKKPLLVEDVSDCPYFSPEEANALPYRSIWVLPLVVNQCKLGTANICFEQVHTPTEADHALAKQASYQIALALFKTHLLETARNRATEAETLQQAGAAISATLELDQTIEIILEQLNRVVPYDSASVQLLRGNHLEIVGQRGFEDPDVVLGLVFSIESDDAPNHLVLDRRAPIIIKDAPAAYESFQHPPHNHIRGWMGVPLIVQDRIIGMIALDSSQPDRFTQDHARLASAFAAQVAIALENARLYEETRHLSITDSLTGIFNRRHFINLAQREFQRSRRYQRPLSLIMMDLDHFKKINDDHGHLVGDKVLRTVAKLCEKKLRESDIIGRYGGEEFLIMLPETPTCITGSEQTEHDATAVAERLRQIVASTPTQTARGEISITISLGVAELSEDMDKLETLIDRADQALYQAKKSGRNRVVVLTP